jgi:Rha family phage regulatory protein
MSQSALGLAPVLAVVDGIPTTTSVDVARHFVKPHDDVLKRIRVLASEIGPDRLGYFSETVIDRPNPSGGAPIQSPAYRLTRDGFTLLAMGFTGKKALGFKLTYIDAFNRMEAALRAPVPAKPALPPHDAERIKAAGGLSERTACAVFSAVMAAENWRGRRWIIGIDPTGYPAVQNVPHDAEVLRWADLPVLIGASASKISDRVLALIGNACALEQFRRVDARHGHLLAGDVARITNYGNDNHGALVRLIRQYDNGDWEVQALDEPLKLRDGGTARRASGRPEDLRRVRLGERGMD